LSAGWDLYSSENVVVPARGRALIKTGIKLIVQIGTYGRIAPRSGLALKNGIDVGAGVIDADYRGEVGILLFNFSDSDFQVHTGDRVAQLILEKIVICELREMSSDEWNTTTCETIRGEGGFGSTGR
jgi:dUTP pyrophosphatase